MYRLKYSIIILLLALMLNESCNKTKKDDLSFTVEEYNKLGIPDPGRVWKFDDYINSNITLGSLKVDNKLNLPRKQSKKSGLLFSRLISKDNLYFLNDTTLPLRSRAYMIQEFVKFPRELYKIYNDNTQETQYYNDELIDIDIFTLYVNEQMLALADKIMNSKDEGDISIQSGLKTVKYNYLKYMERLLADQVKSEVFSASSLKLLSLEVTRSLRENYKWILPADRNTIYSEIEKTISETKSSYIRKKYSELLKFVKK